MRACWIILPLLLASPAAGQPRNPFRALKFDRVVLYDYEPTTEDLALIDARGRLVASAKIKKQVPLPAASSMALTRRLGTPASYGQATAFCFNPHLGIVYYYKGLVARYALVCLDCNELRADVEIPAQQQLKQDQGTRAYYAGSGMSKPFQQFLNELLKRYGFSHQLKPASLFD